MEGRKFEHCFKIRIMLLHCVGGVIEHQAQERVKLVRGGKPKSPAWTLEYRDTFEFSTITVKRGGEKGDGGGRWRGGRGKRMESRGTEEGRGVNKRERSSSVNNLNFKVSGHAVKTYMMSIVWL